ncbi:MAG: hypothetical protein AUG74_20190 [Bacteroidetes bacterium 13_1_20CM_4_60_6]|nr:MAG: hypothetical protein AUG74_20190 [Bacteroidetes bacterium 13_1_20CM_4_60_6]
MKEVKRIVMALLIWAVLSAGTMGTLAQKGSNDNRPPKEPEKVKEPNKPPPSNNNSQGNSNRKGHN